MAELPLTRLAVSTDKQNRIRSVVGRAETLAGIAHVAHEQDVDALTPSCCELSKAEGLIQAAKTTADCHNHRCSTFDPRPLLPFAVIQ